MKSPTKGAIITYMAVDGTESPASAFVTVPAAQEAPELELVLASCSADTSTLLGRHAVIL